MSGLEERVVVVVSLAPFQFSLSLHGKELGKRRSRPQGGAGAAADD